MFAARVMSKTAAPARAAVSRAAVAAPRRGMAGAPPKYTGWEAKVREKLPKDEHVVVAISGFYVGLYGLSKVLSALFSSPKKEEVAAPVVAAVTSTSTDIPAGSGDDFWQWLDGAGNMEKYLATIDAAE